MRTAHRSVALLALALGCAGARTPHHTDEPPVGYGFPEPDPSCHGIVQRSLVTNGLEQVTVRVALGPGGRPQIVELLSPVLTPAAATELRRAFAECAWKPGDAPGEGSVRVGTVTVRRE